MNESKSKAISDYATDARNLWGMAEQILESPPPGLNAAIKANVEELLKQAVETERLAGDPVNIGIVGEFSAGKTLLIGALIGYADGLPVERVPTTGNVTALRFTQHEGLATTKFLVFTIEYMNDEEARECLGAMIGKVGKSAKAAPLRADLLNKLARYDWTDRNWLADLDPWCGEAWASSKDPDLRTDLLELVGFMRAYFHCGRGMCKSEPYEVPPGVAREGLELPGALNLESMTYADLPPAPPNVTSPPESLDATLIRQTFPLIRRVRVDVSLSREIWDLSDLTGENNFVLLDFPGLGSSFSGMRDRFLMERELKKVQTILIVVSSKKSGGKAWEGLLDPLRESRSNLQDAVLVTFSRFDELELNNDGKKRLKALAQAAGAAPGGPGGQAASASKRSFDDLNDEDFRPDIKPAEDFSEASVLESLGVLKSLTAPGELLVQERKDRIVLTSPMLYFHQLRAAQPRLEVGSAKFLDNLEADVQGALEVQPDWAALAGRLKAATADRKPVKHGLTQWLGAFVADGGIDQLRKLIGSHVQRHGLGQLHNDVKREGEKLRTLHMKLNGSIAPHDAGAGVLIPDDKAEAVQGHFDKLVELYSGLTKSIARDETLLVEIDGKPESVSRVVERETVFQIYEWPHWDALFQACDEAGYISEVDDLIIYDPHGGPDDDGPNDDEAPQGISLNRFPNTSEDFREAFEKTFERLQGFTRSRIESGLDYWLNQLKRKLDEERRELAPLLAARNLQARIKGLGQARGAHKALLLWLQAAIDPPRLKEYMEMAGPPEGETKGPEPDANRLFPLAQKLDDRDTVRVFGWSRELQEQADPASRPARNLAHVAQVIRLRNEFVRVLTEVMAQTVSVAVKDLNIRLAKILTHVNRRLAVVTSDDRVRDTLIAAALEAEDAPPTEDPSQSLRQFITYRWHAEP